jgi:hypothetical protein
MKAHRGTRPHAEPTSERLAQALEQAGAPGWMIAKARVKAYDDYQDDSATPIVDLVRDCEANGLSALAQREGRRVPNRVKILFTSVGT